MGYIGMYGPKGYGFSAVLVINRVSINSHFAAIVVINRVSINSHFAAIVVINRISIFAP